MKGIYRQAGQPSQDAAYVFDEQLAVPEVTQGCILVQVKACGLSYIPNQIFSDVFHKNPHLQLPAGLEVAGEVTLVGPGVAGVQKGNRVAGIVPLDAGCSGCAEFCLLSEYDVVRIPEKVSYVDAAACVMDGLKAYIALHYQARLCAGDTVLITDGASSWGSLAIQLARLWGSKVMATASTAEERSWLENLEPPLAQVISVGSKNNILLSTVMEETGGIGVDVVIDNGVQMFSSEEEATIQKSRFAKPHKHHLISCLGVGGRWVSSQPNLQLDPPDCQQMFLKGAGISFLFEHAWLLSTARQGSFQHILHDLMQKLASGELRSHVTHQVTELEQVVGVLYQLPDVRVGKVVLDMTEDSRR